MSGIGAIGMLGGYYSFAMQNAADVYGSGSAGSLSGGQGGAVKGAMGADGVREGECRTCAERKYVDGSDDAGVSFQTPTNIKPEVAASAVMAHEQEHVVREQAKAHGEGREVISQSVKLHGAVCPECGRSYVSGGTTTTTTGQKDESKVTEPGKGENFDRIA